jgi:zinc/manganese transport system permease protein
VSWDFAILGPALAAGLIVAMTHVPLGIQVLNRGIVFLDLAVAQIAALGVVLAGALGFEAEGPHVQLAALASAIAGALLLNWTDRRWPTVQEAVIGVVFILAANAAILLLAANPHGAEHLRDLLVGQILWVNRGQLAWALLVSAVVAAVWFGFARSVGRMGFYLLFACAVTLAVQLVGIYLVFATLIIPALATRLLGRLRMAAAYALAAFGYAAGLALSLWTDLPAGPLVVCTMTALGLTFFVVSSLGARTAHG